MRQRFERWVCNQCSGTVDVKFRSDADYSDRPVAWRYMQIVEGPEGRREGHFCTAWCAARWVQANEPIGAPAAGTQ